MNVVTIFRNLRYFDRYFHQMNAIANFVDNFYVFYSSGVPKDIWNTLQFIEFKVPSIPGDTLKAFFAKSNFLSKLEPLKPDILYAISNGWQQEYMRFSAEKLRKTFIIRVRGDYKKIEKVSKSNIVNKIIKNFIRERSFKQSNLIIPISKRNKRDILDWGYLSPDKISEPIYNGVNTSLFKPTSKKTSHFTVGYIGRLSPEKGISTLIKIMNSAKDVKFIVAGRIQMDIDFPDNCEYLGRLSYEEMPKIYNNSDVILLTSETEGFPNIILEAYACSTPVITHKNIFPEEIPIFGIVQNDNNPLSYLTSIKRIQKNEYSIIDSRDYIKTNFSWESFGKNIVSKFKQIM